jgi:hypothetical protein
MMDATLFWGDPRDEVVIYCERFGDTLRKVSIGCRAKGNLISCCGFSFGWRKALLAANTAVAWHYPHDNVPFTAEDRKRVLTFAQSWLSMQGYEVKVDWDFQPCKVGK